MGIYVNSWKSIVWKSCGFSDLCGQKPVDPIHQQRSKYAAEKHVRQPAPQIMGPICQKRDSANQGKAICGLGQRLHWQYPVGGHQL